MRFFCCRMCVFHVRFLQLRDILFEMLKSIDINWEGADIKYNLSYWRDSASSRRIGVVTFRK